MQTKAQIAFNTRLFYGFFKGYAVVLKRKMKLISITRPPALEHKYPASLTRQNVLSSATALLESWPIKITKCRTRKRASQIAKCRVAK